MEKFEELKKDILKSIEYREDIPIEIVSMTKKILLEVSNIYDKFNCNDSAIQQYLEGKFDEIKKYLSVDIGKKRKNEKLEQVGFILRKISKEMEEINQESNRKRYENEFLTVESNNRLSTNRVLGLITDSILNIQSRQNKILDARGFSDQRINQINQEVRAFIRFVQSKNEEKIYELFVQDDKYIQNKLIKLYEDYLISTKKDKREEFLESVDAKISLEEQHKFAVEKVEEVNNKQQEEKSENALRSDYIE